MITPAVLHNLILYQFIKMWLSCRESTLLSRPFTSDEVQQWPYHVCRNATILAENPRRTPIT